MPDYDLGRAHGKIVIDGDTKGADKAGSALSALERIAAKLEVVVTKLDRTLDRLEAQLKDVASAAREADSALDSIDGEFVSVHKSSTRASHSIGDFNANMEDLVKTARVLQTAFGKLYRPVNHVRDSLDAFNNASGAKSYLLAIDRTLLLSRAMRALGFRILGANKAYASLNERQSKFVNMAGKLTAVAAGFGIINKVGPSLLKFAAGLGVAQKAGTGFAKGFQKVIDIATTGDGRMNTFAKRIATVAFKADETGSAFHRLYKATNTVVNGLDGVGRSAVQTLIGFKIAQQGVAKLRQQFSFLGSGKVRLVIAGIAAAVALIGPAAEIGAKALTILSNAFNLILNAGKQLAGGLFAIPGVIATIAASVIPVVASLKRLGKQFKDTLAAETPEDLAKALEALPEKLRPLGKRLAEVKKTLEDLSDVGVDSFLGKDPIKEIDALENALKGPVTKGFQIVNNAARQFRQELVSVLTDGKNISVLNTVFQSAGTFIGNMRKALDPFISGMGKLVATGSQFFAQWTSGASNLADKFNAFITTAQETGKLRKWMDDAVSGAKDLVKGVVAATKAVWALLTLFATDSGDNALERFAKSMEKFNAAVQKSKAEGKLKAIADTVKNLGFDKLENLKSFFADIAGPIGDLLKVLGPMAKAFSEAFSEHLASTIKIIAAILESFFSAFEGMEGVIGSILGFVAAGKLIGLIIAPMLAATKTVAGMIVAFKGLQGVLYSTKAIAFVGFLDAITGKGNKASAVFDKIERGATKAQNAIAGFGKVLGGFAAGATVLYLGIQAARQQIDDFNDTLQEGKKGLVDYKESLRSAFNDDKGLVGKNVFDTVTDGMTQMRAQLDKEASQVPDLIDNIQDLWFGGGGKGDSSRSGMGIFSTAQSNDFNNLQKLSQDAERAKKKFDDLGLSSQDLAAIVTGSDSSFKSFNETLRASGDNGNEAANQLQQQRDIYKGIQSDYATMTPGSVGLADAIRQIAEAGGDAASQLSALKSALSALGLDKTTEIENALAFSKAIKAMGDEAKNAVDQSAGLDNIFGPDGLLNTSDGGANVENLFNVVKQGVQEFQKAAVDTKDVQGSFQRLIDTVPDLAQAFTVAGGDVEKTKQNILNLIQSVGGDNATISLLLAVTGQDKVKQDIANLILNYQQVGPGQEVKIPLHADTTAMQAELDKLLGSGVAAVGENSITIGGANFTPQVLKQLQEAIPGLQVPGQPPAKPAEVAVEPKPPVQGPQAAKPEAPQQTALDAIAPTRPPPPPPPVDTTQIDAANAKIKELTDKITALQATPIAPTIDPTLLGQLDQIAAKLAEVQTKVNEFTAKDVTFAIKATGVDETVYVLSSQIPQAIAKTVQGAAQISNAFSTAFAAAAAAGNAFVANVSAALAGLVAGAAAQGSAFVDAFASGLSSNGAAVAAAQQMAADIKAQFHQSPPKKGPLSAHGDAAKYAGSQFVNAYATGMSGNDSASGAASRMAGGVLGSAQAGMGPFDIGKLLGSVNDFLSIGSKLADIFGQISDQIFQALKFASDPLGQGTFFGKSPGSAFGFRRDPNVSDAELAQKRLNSKADKDAAKTDKEQKQADQTAADQKKQTDATVELLDQVENGATFAPVDKPDSKTTNADGTPKTGTKAKPLPTTDETPKAKTDQQIQDAAINAAADASARVQKLSPEDQALLNNGDITVKTQDQMLAELVKQTPLLQDAIDVSKNTDATQDQSIAALGTISQLIDAQGEAKTPAAKQQKDALEGLSSTIQSNAGLTTGQNPIDQAASIGGAVANTAKDIFASIQAVMDSVGAAKNLGDILVRGVENTEDVMKIIDNVQQFITTAAQIAQAVSSGLSTAAGIAGATGGSDMGAATGALSAASTIASLISGALSTINAVIDLGQEAYHIAGKYVGEFLGFLTGGAGGQLMGDVRFLLDENDGTLKTWSRDNPDDKRSFDNPFQAGGITEQTPQIGSINVYGGPGQDPRDMTNEMMFAVAAAGNGAGGYN